MKNRIGILYRSVLLLFLCSALFLSCSQDQAQTEAQPDPNAGLMARMEPLRPSTGQILEVDAGSRLDLDFLAERIPLFFEHYPAADAKNEVLYWNIIYSSSDFDGSPVQIRAQFFLPVFSEEAEVPLYVFASGTTGIDDGNAPSLEIPEERRWGWYRENMYAYANQGIAVMFPDYTGFHDTERAQRYFSKEAEGRMMLDAIRAAFAFARSYPDQAARTAARISESVFTSGYSQGGHAAFAAADIRPDYAPEVPLRGVISYGSTNDVEALVREGVAYTPAILYSYREMYGSDLVDPAKVLQDRFLPNFDEQAIVGVDVFQVFYGFDSAKVYRPEFSQALYSGDFAASYPELSRLFAQNLTGLDGHGLPALIIQGGKDFIVTDESQTLFATKLEAQGSEVELRIFPEASHRYTRHAGYPDTLRWIREHTR